MPPPQPAWTRSQQWGNKSARLFWSLLTKVHLNAHFATSAYKSHFPQQTDYCLAKSPTDSLARRLTPDFHGITQPSKSTSSVTKDGRRASCFSAHPLPLRRRARLLLKELFLPSLVLSMSFGQDSLRGAGQGHREEPRPAAHHAGAQTPIGPPSGGTKLTTSPHTHPLLLSHRGNSLQRILILLKYFCMISSGKCTLLCFCAFLTTHVDGWTKTQKHKARTAQPSACIAPNFQ